MSAVTYIYKYKFLNLHSSGEREICDEDFVIVELEYRKAKQYYIAKVGENIANYLIIFISII